MEKVSLRIVKAGVTIDVVDVGRGFSQVYQNLVYPPLISHTNENHSAFEKMKIPHNAELWAEPSRYIATKFSSLLTRVNLVRGNDVFLNDEGLGALYDAIHVNWQYPYSVYNALGK